MTTTLTWCETCHNTGEVVCYRGGDTCVCENYGVMLCPACDGFQDCQFDDD